MPTALETSVKLTIECMDIADQDWMSKSDPMVIVSQKQDDGSYKELGCTEWLKNERNPKFTTKIDGTYHFEVKQHLLFVVKDIDDPQDLSKGNEIGRLECTMGQICGSLHCKLTKDLVGEKEDRKYGTISIMAEQTKGRKTDKLRVIMKGIKILNKDGFMGKSDPFLIFKRKRADGGLEDVEGGKSNTVDNAENPQWEPMLVNMMDLCHGDIEAPILIECWDYDSASGNDQIGLVETNVKTILSGEEIQMKDYKEGRDLDPGKLQMVEGCIERVPNFFDYLESGYEFTVTIAVDYTMSNKAIDDPESLHHMAPDGQLNQYEHAIKASCGILVNYDHDKKFSLYGYGGIPPGKEEADHCFAVTFDEQNPDVEGVEGVLETYRASLDQVKLYGPTNFADVIKQSTTIAREARKSQYQVLLILTDGDITDMQQTKDAIVEACDHPMSVVIVGVGNEDFEMMHELDADKGGLVSSSGQTASRDLVQFIPYKQFHGNDAELSQHILGEIPFQLLQYMCKNGNAPPSWQGTNFKLPPGDWSMLAVQG